MSSRQSCCPAVSPRTVNGIHLLDGDGADPGALGTAGYEEYVASAEGHRSRGILQRHASLEQVHQLDVTVSHCAAVVRRRIPGAAHELAIGRAIIAVVAA